jgi:hypothetical protein
MRMLIVVGLAVLAAALNWDETGLRVFAIINAIAAFWTVGIVANFRDDPYAAPPIAGMINLTTVLISLVLLVVGYVR